MSLKVENLKVDLGSFKLRVPSFEVAPGEVLCIVGKSGSGKSTLLNAISGFVPSQGRVFVSGRDVSDLPPEQRQIAFAFQRPALFPHLTVWENIAFADRIRGASREEQKKNAEAWLNRLGLSELRDRKSHEISEGQAQRVAIARALNAHFPVLLLDEPFSALDEKTRVEIRTLIAELTSESGVAAVMVTHHADDIVGKRSIAL